MPDGPLMSCLQRYSGSSAFKRTVLEHIAQDLLASCSISCSPGSSLHGGSNGVRLCGPPGWNDLARQPAVLVLVGVATAMTCQQQRQEQRKLSGSASAALMPAFKP